jgi:hypothetical protein
MAELKRYRKKPVEIEAIQWDGTAAGATPIINWVLENGSTARYYSPNGIDYTSTHEIAIRTLEGTMWARRGDFIIRGVQGEFYPCKPDIFAQTYEEAN